MPGASVTFCGHPLSDDELALIRDCVARFTHLSRAELAATVCEWLDWQRPNGRLKTRECRDLLEELAARELLALPALRAGRPRGRATTVAHTRQCDAQAAVTAALPSLQPIRLRRVEQPAERALWRELMDRHHYLGHRTAFGASLRYLIETDAGEQQTLGGLQFSSPAWRMRARDAWIGWSEPARQRHLPRLINNSRFLILPNVQVAHLASHVLGLALRRVAVDWEAAYGLRPWLAETLVDPQRFTGTCYRAANWLDVGLTTGRGRQDRQHARHNAATKRIFLYPLRADACEVLSAEP